MILKHDAGKSRIDLIEADAYSTIREMVDKCCPAVVHLDNDDLAEIMSEEYAKTMKYVYKADGRDDYVGLLGNIAACASVMLENDLQIEEITQLGDLYGYGAEMHSENSWKKVESSRFYAALGRHINYISTGELYDSESKMQHALHILWNCITLTYFVGE